MAGRVSYSNADKTCHDPNVKSPSTSYEEFSTVSNQEYVGDILPISRAWSNMSGCSTELNSQHQLQEQYRFSVDQCLKELKNARRKNETMFIQVKKSIREKIEYMLKIVKQSFEYMHTEGTKQIEAKCEEIGRVLTRVEKMIEEANQEFSSETTACNRGNSNNRKFLEKSLKEKQRIELEVEAVIIQLNKKRESDEQIFMEFKEDIQQQLQSGISCIERSLEELSEHRIKTVEEKITELRRALANLRHLSEFP